MLVVTAGPPCSFLFLVFRVLSTAYGKADTGAVRATKRLEGPSAKGLGRASQPWPSVCGIGPSRRSERLGVSKVRGLTLWLGLL